MNTSSSDSGRVIDAPSTNWVYRTLPKALWPYAQLARWDRPIGWQLLMWPCFWSAGLAANAATWAESGMAQMSTDATGVLVRFVLHLALFLVGSVAMRGAGCTYNDIVDERIDMAVARTRSRPLPSGRVSRRSAKIFMVLQALVGLGVLLQFNMFSILLGIFSLGFVAIYPFAKRFTDWPQLFLGLAFSWGAVMGWAAAFGSLSLAPVVLYLAAIAWTVGYDTIYAYQDREDDELVGVRSTARRFGERPRPWLIALYGVTVVLLAMAFALAGVGPLAYLGLAMATVMLFYQIMVLDIHDAGQCLTLFRFNGMVGLIVFAGLTAAFLVRLF